MYFKIALDFRIVFDTIFHQIFLDFRSQRTPKIKLKQWSVLIFYTFSDFRLGSLVESILNDFGIDFERLLASIFKHFREKRAQKLIKMSSTPAKNTLQNTFALSGVCVCVLTGGKGHLGQGSAERSF